ncbi:MAG: transposase [Deltaproteobacteria bacterium]|nr:transposase [Deltaproteobacteria bacterium]
MRRGSRKRHVQLSLDQARRPDGQHGGWRPGAGRPAKPGAVSHATRANQPGRFPQHVTLRIQEGVPSLAREGLMKIIRGVVRGSHKDASGGRLDAQRLAADARDLASAGGFRIVEFNVLGNHLHLLVEAANKDVLARGVQGFCVSAARRLNSALMRKGKLFAHRYHARALKTPREARNVLAYVLLNRKHHDAEKRYGRFWIDPCSSAAWSGAWAERVRTDDVWKRELVAQPWPTAPPATWLLATGWKRHGLLRFDERPG